ncbi:MAG: hypothetical protein ABI894_13585 [Ilumatobacteraceae bacterium]
MNRRSFLSIAFATPVIAALAACGDPDQEAAATNPTTPGYTTPDTNPGLVIAHLTGADDVVLKLAHEGGFVPAGFLFVNTPALLVSGDRRVFTQGAVPAIFPGPLLPTVLVRTITEDGLQALLALVQHAGLLSAAPDYSGGDNVADASSTVLTINGGTFVHNAYALGIDTPESPARQKLLDVTTAFGDIQKAAGAANLGPDGPFEPTAYRLQARAVDPIEASNQDPAATVVDWPAASGVSLATATECARVDAAAVGSLFTDARQNTYFKEDQIVYQVSVAGMLPGDPNC